jgi:hypothetical protein
MTKRAWSLVKPETIVNCFRKSGFTPQVDDVVMEDDEPSTNIFDSLGISVDDFAELVDCDVQLECYGDMTDEDIVAEVRRTDEIQSVIDEEEVEEVVEVERAMPSRSEIFGALDVLRNAFQFKGTKFDNLYALEDDVHAIMSSAQRQSLITQYLV